MGTLGGWPKETLSEHEYLLGIIGFIHAVSGLQLSFV